MDTTNSPNANEFSRFTDSDTIEGRTYAEARSDLELNTYYAGSSQVSGRFYPSSLGKSLMNFSANKSLYPTSSNVNRDLINSISSNLDTRVDSLFNWSSNKTLYANSANVRSRFPASSTAISRYADSSNIRSRFPGSSNLNRTMLNATSGSLHNLWNWSSNKSWYANSSNVRYRFPASSTAISIYAPSTLTLQRYNQYVGHSGNTAVHSFNVANYIVSTNAIDRFADSSNIRYKFKGSSNRWVYVSSQNISGGTLSVGRFYGNTISGIAWPLYPSSVANRNFIDVISGALNTKIGTGGGGSGGYPSGPRHAIQYKSGATGTRHGGNYQLTFSPLNNRFALTGNMWVKGAISSQTVSGGTVTTTNLILNANRLSGLSNPTNTGYNWISGSINKKYVDDKFYPSSLGKSLMNFSSNKSLYANSANVRYRFKASSNNYWTYVSSQKVRSFYISTQHLSSNSLYGYTISCHTFKGPSVGGGSGTPTAPVNSVQFNDASSFGGDVNFIWDKNINRLSITGAIYLKGGISSQNVSGGSIKVNSLTLNASVLSGLSNPRNTGYNWPSGSVNKKYTNYPDYVSSQAISGGAIQGRFKQIVQTNKPAQLGAFWFSTSAANANYGQLYVATGNTNNWMKVTLSK